MPARSCRVEREAAERSAVLEALGRHLPSWLARYAPDPRRLHVLRRILACRTASLGHHLWACEDCGRKLPMYNPCRDRHCPQCSGKRTLDWLEERRAMLLPTPHFQVVFTLPAELRSVAIDNQKMVYGLLFSTATSVLQDLAGQHLEARLGLLSVLHTWKSDLRYHPHVHCLVTAGGLHQDGDRWVPSQKDWLFSGKVMGSMFRGRFLEGLIDAHQRGELKLRGEPALADEEFRVTTKELARRHARWVVHVEPPMGRPVEHVTRYLARYVKRIAIGDRRIREITDDGVTIATRQGLLTLEGHEFVRRFALHVLPKGFRKVRYHGLYGPGMMKISRERARELLQAEPVSIEHRSEEDEPATLLDGDDGQPTTKRRERCPFCGNTRVMRMFFLGGGRVRIVRAPP